MTFKNNREPLLCYFKLCPSFCSHWWIQTGVKSPETPNLGQIWRFLVPCDLEIWQMTLKNNRAPLLNIIKLYASFHHHMWIQTRVTVRKRLSWVLTSVTLTFDLWTRPFAWTSLLSLVITPENFMMIRWWEYGEKGVTDGQTDGRTDGLNQSYSCLVAAKNNRAPLLCYFKLCAAFRTHSRLDTNGCPLGNSKFILLSDNLNICLWLSACQVQKINQINNYWSTIYQRLGQPEATFRKCKHIWPAVHSFLQMLCVSVLQRRVIDGLH